MKKQNYLLYLSAFAVLEMLIGSGLPMRGLWSGRVEAQANIISIPATYYGRIDADGVAPNFQPSTGVDVEAYVGNVRCGLSLTAQSDNEVVYRIDVLADGGAGGKDGCGTNGATITFVVDSNRMHPSASWSNEQLIMHNLHASGAPTLTPTAISVPTSTSLPDETPFPVGTALPTPIGQNSPTPNSVLYLPLVE